MFVPIVKRRRDSSYERGIKCENAVQEFLDKNYIPYWMNVSVKSEKIETTEYDFIIPNATIECKFSYNSSRLTNLIKQLSIQLKYTDNALLYVYFLKISEEQIKELKSVLITDIKENDRIRIITDLNDLMIHKKDYSYVVMENNILYPFITDYTNKGSICYVDYLQYYKLELITEDMKIFDDYKINLFDKDKIYCSQTSYNINLDMLENISKMTNNTTIMLRSKLANPKISIKDVSKVKYLLNIFHKLAITDPTYMSNKFPNKYIENISKLCSCGTHYIFSGGKKYNCIINKTIIGVSDTKNNIDDKNIIRKSKKIKILAET
jgi:hypothetical protein